MSEALQLIPIFLDRFLKFVFNIYIVDGVSIGMFLIGVFIFSVLLKFLLAVPNVKVGGSGGSGRGESYKKDH